MMPTSISKHIISLPSNLSVSSAKPRATKIVATLGPASDSKANIHALIKAGVDVFRLNFSHGTALDHQQRAETVREAAQELGREVAIMADLQGPKIRVGKFEKGEILLVEGENFILDACCTLGNQTRVGLDYPDLVKDLNPGDTLLLNDGLIVLQVAHVKNKEIHTVVKTGGELSNNKGINRQGGGLSAPALTEKDKSDLKAAIALKAEFIAISFPKNAADMNEARALAEQAIKSLNHANEINLNQNKIDLNSDPKRLSSMPKMIAKIERVEAIAALDEILQASEGIMVARGDLAVEVGNACVPALQKDMIKRARKANRFVITATQMMESMIYAAAPTRAEVSDVANAVLDGTDAVMLSAETAAGKYPVKTVEIMAGICVEAERSQGITLEKAFLNQIYSSIDQAIAIGAVFTAFHLEAKAIVALTESGATALWMSRHTSHVPIFALTPHQTTARTMAAYHNVTPIHSETSHDRDEALRNALNILVKRQLVNYGDLVVMTCGEKMCNPGGSNLLRIVKVEE